MARTREPKLTLGYFIDDGCIGLDAWCQSHKCSPSRPRLMMVADLMRCKGVTRLTRLDQVEARMRCVDCGTKGEVDLRPHAEFSSLGPKIR